jgi:hypothetical protein
MARARLTSNVLIVPCDAPHFADSPSARCNLYVAMSRATRSLTIVASRQKPSSSDSRLQCTNYTITIIKDARIIDLRLT